MFFLHTCPLIRIALPCAWPIPVAARSKTWVCGRSLARIAGSNTAGSMEVFCCECCVLSGRGFCVRLITRPEDSYRMWCVWVWLWSHDNEEALVHWGLLPDWGGVIFIYGKCRVVPVIGHHSIKTWGSGGTAPFILISLIRGADKSLARPTSRCILFDGENISFDASLVIYK